MKMFTKLFLIVASVALAQATEFRITNKESRDIWIGIQGNEDMEHLANGGFILKAGETKSIEASDTWGGRFWARTWCDPKTNHCLTGDCGNKLECKGAGGNPPATLAEITLLGWGGIDYYDLSNVDGFNIKATIEPIGGQGDGSQYSCKKAQCVANINKECPSELALKNENSTIGCNSACNAFHTDQYCCAGEFQTPETCKSSLWPVDYPKFFKDRCPDAYSYAYDDHKSTFTCIAKTYVITFGG